MFQILEFNKYLQLQYSFLFCPLSHALLSIYRCKMTNSQFFKCNHDVKQVLPFWTTCCLKNTLLRLFQIIIQIPFKLHTFQNPSALGHLNSPQVWYSDPNSNIKLLMLQQRYEIMETNRQHLTSICVKFVLRTFIFKRTSSSPPIGAKSGSNPPYDSRHHPGVTLD